MTEITEHKLAELVTANKELAIQNHAMALKAAELILENKELSIQNQGMVQRGAELILENKALAIENQEMTRQAAELVIANKELAIQAELKAQRAAELVIANKELAVQAELKAQRAAELVIANEELAVQAELKAQRAAELVIANEELAVQIEEKILRASELVIEKAKAEAANVAKSTFLANMSHEIRTPLNGIIGMAYLMQREGLTPRQADHLAKLDIAAQHLLVIINNILDISKIEAGKFVLEEAPIHIESLMANVSSILSERIKTRNIRLLIQAEALPPNLIGDPTRLQQALLNYTTNALKFSENGDVILRSLKQEENADSVLVRFEVQDTGIGISPETILRLFSAFEQADNSTTRKFGGSGLGLVITRRLAELMGGEAGVVSSPGMGSTFWFTARLKKGVEAARTLPTEIGAAEADLQHKYFGHRVLVVDDDPINREVAQIQLEAVDLIVDTAEDGLVAFTMAQRIVYSAIFMDMQMPNLDGIEATKQIREIPGYRQVPIIAMTANAFAEDKAHCFAAGMSDFLTKPFDPDTLFTTLLRSLG